MDVIRFAVLIPTRGNWFQTNPALDDESDDRTSTTSFVHFSGKFDQRFHCIVVL